MAAGLCLSKHSRYQPLHSTVMSGKDLTRRASTPSTNPNPMQDIFDGDELKHTNANQALLSNSFTSAVLKGLARTCRTLSNPELADAVEFVITNGGISPPPDVDVILHKLDHIAILCRIASRREITRLSEI